MSSVREQAIAGFNHFLADQAREPGTARLALVLFDDEYLVPVAAAPLPQVAPLAPAALREAIHTEATALAERHRGMKD
jgi:hypothetical protein